MSKHRILVPSLPTGFSQLWLTMCPTGSSQLWLTMCPSNFSSSSFLITHSKAFFPVTMTNIMYRTKLYKEEFILVYSSRDKVHHIRRSMEAGS